MRIQAAFSSVFFLALTLFSFGFFPARVFAQDAACIDAAQDNHTVCRAAISQAYDDCVAFGEQTPATCQTNRDEFLNDCDTDLQAALRLCAPAAAPASTTPSTTTSPSIAEQFQSIQEQGIIFANICESRTAVCDCRDTGRCTLNDILQVAVNLMVFILGISGTVVLLMFVYGGFLWLTAAGRPEAISTGKNTMIGAVVGLIIIFGSYAAITLLISVLKTGDIATGNLEDVVGGGAENVVETAP